MPLSRLENFLKNIQGNVIYVDPNELDATDSIENQGNSQTRPFKTIQRALIEASRFSYVAGQRNDKFDLTTIILSAGTHTVDNRPGWIPYASGSSSRYYTRFGNSNQILSPFGLGSNFDLTAADNELYKLNSVRGGVIIPRGTSIVGKDLRKTKIRPKYVPDPENDLIESSAIFRLTGACYISQFTIFDGDPSGNVYKDYTSNLYTPNFSHHKLTCFEYADGANTVTVNDSFLNVSSTSTDLDMYYQKVGDVYDAGTGRPIDPDFPSGDLDFQTRVEEYRIVGSTGQQVGISSIKAGNGVNSSTTITVDMESSLTDLSIDTPVRISGISTSGYDGIFVVSEVLSNTQFKYVVTAAPNNPLPTLTSANVNIEVDTINSASPYLFNLSKRSVFGMNGILLDGAKVTGFKSGLMAQFTGNALQKDDKAFVRYNTTSGQYDDSSSVSNLHLDPEAVYKPTYNSSHVKASNDAVIQAVSVFAIGHNNQYVAETGGELSLSNCNANFGENALMSEGFKTAALGPDNSAYITHLIPPKEITDGTVNVDYLSLDVDKTIGVGTVTRLYFEGFTNQDAPPPYIVDGYRFGANQDDRLRVQLNVNGNEGDFISKIVMPTATGITTDTSQKRYIVDNAVGVSSISSNTIIFKSSHSLIDGESVRINADNGFLPDGIEEDTVYFAIVSGVAANSIKIARTLNDALEGTALTVNNTGGELTVTSRVSDKKSGDIGHPIQFDIPNKNWYVNVSNETIDNEIYPTFVGVGTTALGANTPKTYFTRTESSRGINDSIYKFRYVIPAGITTARPPIEGYVLQETNDTTGASDAEVTTTSLTNIDDQRNFHFLNEASWSTNIATVMSEEPHNLNVGDIVNVNKITSANNATGIGSSGFNGRYSVIGITSDRGFQYSLTADPGSSTLDSQTRTVDNLPNFSRNEYGKSFYVYESEEIKKHITGEQDGVYHLTALHYDVAPTVSPFTSYKFSQPVKDLYPQVDRDNPVSDPKTSLSHAVSKTIGKVVSSDLKDSITKDTTSKFLSQNGINVGITSIVSDNGAGLAHTAYLEREHTLNSIVSVGIQSAGWKYGSGSAVTLYGAKLVGVGLGSTSGSGASANVSINANGQITGVTIINGGGAYGIGNSLEVTGITTQAGYVSGILTVSNIYDGIGQVIQIAGITSDTNSKLNNLFKVTSTPDAKRVCFASTEVVDYGRSLGGSSNNVVVGSAMSNATMSVVGPSIGVTNISYDVNTGIATVGTGITAHGLLAGSKVKFIGAGQTAYQGEFIVQEKESLTKFQVNLGVSTVAAPTLSGDVFALPTGYSSADGAVTADDEKLGSRMNSLYVGITTTLSAGITSTSTSISISDATASGLNIGDYIMVNDEMMRIKNTSINTVFRGVFGSKSTNHDSGTIIKKVKVVPVELRRNSLIRAANQTFEYVGFGQGNYSVALPEKQTKVLSTEDRKLGQTQKRNGGQNYYTGLNDSGEYFIGNKVIKGTTGEEEIFDAPITTVTGEDKDIDTTFTDSIKVSGGSNKDTLSEFNAPVIFTNKITSTSDDGIETSSLSLQGDARVARKITVGISTPTTGGTAGDIVFTTKPESGGYAGWIYSTENAWKRFGTVFDEANLDNQNLDNINISGIATVSGDLRVSGGVGIADSIFHIGDTNTAIRFPEADTFTVETAGSERARINSSGLVGIGTDNPARLLHLHGSDSDTVQLHMTNTTTGPLGTEGVSFLLGSDESLILNQRESNDIILKTSDTERLHIKSDGKVGIGTSLPGGNLEVFNSSNTLTALTLRTGAGADGFVGMAFASNLTKSREKAAIYFQETNYGAHYTGDLVFAVNSASGGAAQVGRSDERMRITKGGLIGIGLTTPLQRLHVSGNSVISGSVGIGTTIIGTNSLKVVNDTSVIAQFERVGGEWSKVDIKAGSNTGNSVLTFSDQAAAEVGSIDYEHNDNSMRFYTNAESNSQLTITSAGRIGIGSDEPVRTLDISDVQPILRLRDTSGTGAGGYSEISANGAGFVLRADNGDTEANSYMSFNVDTDEAMRINSSGYLGINDNSPSYHLDVNGDIRAGQSDTQGLILTAPNGSSFRVTVDNSGNLSVSGV